MRLETLRNAVATPTTISRAGQGRVTMSGCIYRQDGSKCAFSERTSGLKGDIVTNGNPDTIAVPEDAQHLPGRSVYLHHWMGRHYGHFITETMANLLILIRESPSSYDYFVFHAFLFGAGMPSFAKDALHALGVDDSRVIIVEDEPIEFETLVVPERLWALNSHADLETKHVYRAISHYFERSEPTPNRIYLSRRKVSRKTFRRVIVNEATIESVFARFGFTIIYPELETFARQVRICSGADVIAGFSGSALHNSVFMRKGATLIEIGHPRYGGPPQPNQTVCNSISEVNSVYLPFTGRVIGSRETVLFRTRNVLRSLQLLFIPTDTTSRHRFLSAQRWRDRFEMATLLLRPLIADGLRLTGAWMRRRR